MKLTINIMKIIFLMIKLSQFEEVLEPQDLREGEDPLSDSPHRYAAAAGVSDPPASAPCLFFVLISHLPTSLF